MMVLARVSTTIARATVLIKFGSFFASVLAAVFMSIFFVGCSQKKPLDCNCTKKEVVIVKQECKKPKQKKSQNGSSCGSKSVGGDDYVTILTE